MQATVATSVSLRSRTLAGLVPVLMVMVMAHTPGALADELAASSLQARAQHATSANLGNTQTTVTAEHSYTLPPGGAGATDNQGRAYTELTGVTVHRWAGTGRASIGLGVGAHGYRASGAGADAQALANPAPSVSVALRYRMAEQATMYADASGTRRLDADGNTPLYNTRVGMEFKGANVGKSMGFERGAIGMQLESGYRISMKPRRGGVGIYLRGNF